MNNKYIDKIEKEMRKGLIEFAVLNVISKDKIYVSDILDTLKKAELITSEGTMYPLMSRLAKEGIVSYEWEESLSGPPRKYYKIMPRGLEMLETYKVLWSRISKSINLLIYKNGK